MLEDFKTIKDLDSRYVGSLIDSLVDAVNMAHIRMKREGDEVCYSGDIVNSKFEDFLDDLVVKKAVDNKKSKYKSGSKSVAKNTKGFKLTIVDSGGSDTKIVGNIDVLNLLKYKRYKNDMRLGRGYDAGFFGYSNGVDYIKACNTALINIFTVMKRFTTIELCDRDKASLLAMAKDFRKKMSMGETLPKEVFAYHARVGGIKDLFSYKEPVYNDKDWDKVSKGNELSDPEDCKKYLGFENDEIIDFYYKRLPSLTEENFNKFLEDFNREFGEKILNKFFEFVDKDSYGEVNPLQYFEELRLCRKDGNDRNFLCLLFIFKNRYEVESIYKKYYGRDRNPEYKLIPNARVTKYLKFCWYLKGVNDSNYFSNEKSWGGVILLDNIIPDIKSYHTSMNSKNNKQ